MRKLVLSNLDGALNLTSKEKQEIQAWLMEYLKDQGISSPDLDSGDLQKLYYPWAILKEKAFEIIEECIRPIFEKYVQDMKEAHVLENLGKYTDTGDYEERLEKTQSWLDVWKKKLSEFEEAPNPTGYSEEDMYGFLKGRRKQLREFWQATRGDLVSYMIRERAQAMFEVHKALWIAYRSAHGSNII